VKPTRVKKTETNKGEKEGGKMNDNEKTKQKGEKGNKNCNKKVKKGE
jgi:hypothetical protein